MPSTATCPDTRRNPEFDHSHIDTIIYCSSTVHYLVLVPILVLVQSTISTTCTVHVRQYPGTLLVEIGSPYCNTPVRLSSEFSITVPVQVQVQYKRLYSTVLVQVQATINTARWAE